MTKSIRCRVGWHRSRVVSEETMGVRVCTVCGRRRYAGPRSDKDTDPAASWGFGYTGGGGLGGDGG